jgi:hypothetical protein
MACEPSVSSFGVLKTQASRQIVTSTCLPDTSQVTLPLSPDHGMFGDDKHYSGSPSKRTSSVGLQKPGVNISAQSLGKPQSRSRCVSAAIVDMRFDSITPR